MGISLTSPRKPWEVKCGRFRAEHRTLMSALQSLGEARGSAAHTGAAS